MRARNGSLDSKKQAEFQFEKSERRPEHYKVNVGQVPEKVDSINFYTEEAWVLSGCLGSNCRGLCVE